MRAWILGLALVAGCSSSPSPPNQVQVEAVDVWPSALGTHLVSVDGIKLPVGIVIAISATATRNGSVGVITDDPSLVSVQPFASKPSYFVVTGLASGTAHLRFTIDGKAAPVYVSAPEERVTPELSVDVGPAARE